MRVAHISDVHLGWNAGPDNLSRFMDISKNLDWTAKKLIEEKVDCVLFCGDAFKDAKIMVDRAEKEISVVVKFLRELSTAGIEVIVISGTPSHDSIASYKFLQEINIPRTLIFTNPSVMTFPPTTNELSVACLPGLNRSALMTQDEYKGLPPEQVHRIMTDKITQMCMGMSAQMPDDKPKILMAHMTYQGADTGFQDLLMQHEPILNREAVAGFDLVCLGHIHRPQLIDGKVFYSGPVERLSFNEEKIYPGFWIHETGVNEVTGLNPYGIYSRFIETPARQFLTLDFSEQQIKTIVDFSDALDENPEWLLGSQIKDAIVRLRYTCSEELAKQLNRKALEKALYDAGAFYVSEIKADIQQADRARDVSVNESLSPLQALEKWCINQGIGESDAKELVSMAGGLMEG